LTPNHKEYVSLPPINVEIRDLHFKNFYRICIGAVRFTGLKIIGNMFTGGRLTPRNPADPYSHPLCIAMLIGGYTIFPATDCTGEVIVEDNIIYGQGFGSTDVNDPGHQNEVVEAWGYYWSGISNGVTSRDLVAFERYKNNRFYDILSTPIASRNSQGETVISHNTLKTRYSWSGNGIIVRDQSIADVRHNITETVGAGIFLWSAYDITIKNNDINLVQDPLASIPRPFPKFRTGILIYESDDNTLQGNKINGHGEWGVLLDSSSNNVLVENNINHFSSTGEFGWPPAHALALNSNNNTFVGGKYSLLNFGQNNNVTGGWEIIDPYGFDVDVGSVGQEVSEAMQHMNDLVP
jgi:parallel beta-helix repeat protein